MADSLGELWKKGTTPPLAGDLVEGGLGMDVSNKKVYSKGSDGALFEIGGGAPADHHHPISDVDGLQAALDATEPFLGTPDITGKLLSSSTNGVRSWITPPSGVTDHTLLTNIGTHTHAQIDTHIEDMTNPHLVTAEQVGAAPTNHTHDERYFQETEYLFEPSGTPTNDAGAPIVLDSMGSVSVGFINIKVFNPQGAYTPTVEAEYPAPIAGLEPGDIWLVEGLGEAVVFTFTTGSLTGKTCKDGDGIVAVNIEEERWAILSTNIDPGTYYRVDGGNPLIANFNASNFKIVNMVDGTAYTDGCSVGQLRTALEIGVY